MKLGIQVGLGPDLIVLDGTQLPLHKKGTQTYPQFLANVYCDHTARWIKIPLGTEVGLCAGDIVLDGDPTPHKTGTHPNFRPMSIVAKLLYASGYQLVRR